MEGSAGNIKAGGAYIEIGARVNQQTIAAAETELKTRLSGMAQRANQAGGGMAGVGGGDLGGGFGLNDFGGKKLIKQEMKYAAANFAGMHGGEVGMAAMAALSGSGAAAVVVAGLGAVGLVVKALEETVKDISESAKKWSEESKKFIEGQHQLGKFLNPDTGAGKKNRDEADRLEKEMVERNKTKIEGPGAWTKAISWLGRGLGNAGSMAPNTGKSTDPGEKWDPAAQMEADAQRKREQRQIENDAVRKQIQDRREAGRQDDAQAKAEVAEKEEDAHNHQQELDYEQGLARAAHVRDLIAARNERDARAGENIRERAAALDRERDRYDEEGRLWQKHVDEARLHDQAEAIRDPDKRQRALLAIQAEQEIKDAEAEGRGDSAKAKWARIADDMNAVTESVTAKGSWSGDRAFAGDEQIGSPLLDPIKKTAENTDAIKNALLRGVPLVVQPG